MKRELSKQDYITGALAMGLTAVAAAKLYKVYTSSKRKIQKMRRENEVPSKEELTRLRYTFNDQDIDGYKHLLFFHIEILGLKFAATIVLKNTKLFGFCLRNVNKDEILLTRKLDDFFGNIRKASVDIDSLKINSDGTVNKKITPALSSENTEGGLFGKVADLVSGLFGSQQVRTGKSDVSVTLHKVQIMNFKTIDFKGATISSVIDFKSGGEQEIEIHYPTNITERQYTSLRLNVVETEKGVYEARNMATLQKTEDVYVEIPADLNGIEMKVQY